jgi:hypothetical protein
MSKGGPYQVQTMNTMVLCSFCEPPTIMTRKGWQLCPGYMEVKSQYSIRFGINGVMTHFV